MEMQDGEINIKGTGEGLLISFNLNEWERNHSLLNQKINENHDFFESARVALDVGDCEIKAAEMGKLCDDLSAKNISIWAILSKSDTTIRNAQTYGIPTQLGLKKKKMLQEDSLTLNGEPAVWIERTLRAGYRIETKCHVVVLGDVNPGAEIVSAGNIFVWGKMNGSVHAGAEGNKDAKIIALQMKPTQLRIANISAVPFTGKIIKKTCAFVNEEKIDFSDWPLSKQN